jgi:hypothetical protein
LRFEVLDHYGDHCACCGEANKWLLTLDHINNDGGSIRLLLGKGRYYVSGAGLFRHIRDTGYPSNIQVLCFNCNQGKSWFGACPHKVSPDP